MTDSSEKRNWQLALNFRIRMFVKSAVIVESNWLYTATSSTG